LSAFWVISGKNWIAELAFKYGVKNGNDFISRPGRFFAKTTLSEIIGGIKNPKRNKTVNKVVMTTRNAESGRGNLYLTKRATTGFNALMNINANKSE
jgi:hypothetical protein